MKDFKIKEFTSLVKDITSGNKKFKTSDYLDEGEYPIIDQGERLIAGFTNENEIVKRKKNVVVFGDHTKKIKYIDFDFCLGADGTKVLEPVEKLDSKFLYYYLKTQKLPHVGYSRHYKFLKRIKIPLPSLKTQKSIAARLDQAEAVKQLNQQLLAKYDALAQSIFLELFGDPVVNEKGWEVKKIFNLVKKTHKINKKYSKRTIDYVDISSIDNKLNVITSTSSYKLENRPSRAQQILEKGDILFSTVRPNLKNIAINNFEKELIGSTGFFVFRTKEDYIQSLFLFYLLLNNSTTSFFNSIVSGANYPAIKNSDLNKMKIIVPPIPLQTEFARRIENIEHQKSLLCLEMAKSEELFESLLQESFASPL